MSNFTNIQPEENLKNINNIKLRLTKQHPSNLKNFRPTTNLELVQTLGLDQTVANTSNRIHPVNQKNIQENIHVSKHDCKNNREDTKSNKFELKLPPKTVTNNLNHKNLSLQNSPVIFRPRNLNLNFSSETTHLRQKTASLNANFEYHSHSLDYKKLNRKKAAQQNKNFLQTDKVKWNSTTYESHIRDTKITKSNRTQSLFNPETDHINLQKKVNFVFYSPRLRRKSISTDGQNDLQPIALTLPRTKSHTIKDQTENRHKSHQDNSTKNNPANIRRNFSQNQSYSDNIHHHKNEIHSLVKNPEEEKAKARADQLKLKYKILRHKNHDHILYSNKYQDETEINQFKDFKHLKQEDLKFDGQNYFDHSLKHTARLNKSPSRSIDIDSTSHSSNSIGSISLSDSIIRLNSRCNKHDELIKTVSGSNIQFSEQVQAEKIESSEFYVIDPQKAQQTNWLGGFLKEVVTFQNNIYTRVLRGQF